MAKDGVDFWLGTVYWDCNAPGEVIRFDEINYSNPFELHGLGRNSIKFVVMNTFSCCAWTFSPYLF